MYLISIFFKNFVYLSNDLELISNLSKMKNLLKKENIELSSTVVEYRAVQHWIIYVLPTFYVVVGLVGLLPAIFGFGLLRVFGFGLLFIFFKGTRRILEIYKTKIYLSPTHLCIQQGILSNSVHDIALEKLEGIHLAQGFIGKYLNFGTLHVSTGEVSQQYRIKDPFTLRSKILTK